MSVVAWVFVAVFAAMSVGCFVSAAAPGLRAGTGMQQAIRWQLPLTPEIDRQLGQAYVRRWTTYGAASAVAAAALAVVVALGSGDVGTWWAAFVLIAVCAGGAHMVLAARSAVSLPASRVRVAHAERARLRDLCSPVGVALSHLAVALALVLLLLAALHGEFSDEPISPWWSLSLAAVLVVFTVVADLVARWVVRRPAATSDAIALAWDEVLRGEVARSVLATPVALTISATSFASASSVGSAFPLSLAVIVLYCVGSILVSQPPRRSQRWQATAAAARAAVPVS